MSSVNGLYTNIAKRELVLVSGYLILLYHIIIVIRVVVV